MHTSKCPTYLIENLINILDELLLAVFNTDVKALPALSQLKSHRSDELFIPISVAGSFGGVGSVVATEGGVVIYVPLHVC